MINIALADDHIPTLKRFVNFFKNLQGYNIVVEALNGHDLILKINLLLQIPEIIFIDIQMPIIDGIAIAYYFKVHHPSIKLIGLSNYCDENSLRSMLLTGADGFVMKALAEVVLKEAVETVLMDKIFIDKRMDFDQKLINDILIKREERLHSEYGLTKREKTFIILNATTLTYRQIAQTMFVEPKTIQTYYDRISKKLKICSRQELTLFSLQNGLAALANYK